MSEALITPEILQWARKRSHLSLNELALKLSQNAEKVELWEKGEKKPTFNQAQKIAHTLHIPFGYLFLETPPNEEETIPDLRTLKNRGLDSLSVDLKEVLRDAQRKQDWYRDTLKDNGYEPLSIIGRFDINAPIDEIVTDINSTLSLSFDDRKNTANWEAFLSRLIDKAEEAGIWVMRSSMVGHNTRRLLHVEEFRGFALCDEYAPLIFVNSADAKAAQIFTLIHEMAHLWLGESGISDVSVDTDEVPDSFAIEKKCNDIAAELLVPADAIRRRWGRDSYEENINTNAHFFKVSKVVIARRAMDLKLMSRDDFFRYYAVEQAKWKLKREKQKETPGGPSFYRLLPINNGKKFTEAVLISVFSQQTLVRNGARLLGVKPDKIDKLAHEVGML